MAASPRATAVHTLREIVDISLMSNRTEFAAHEAQLGPLLDWVERTALTLGAPRTVVAKLRIITEELFVNTLTHGAGASRPDAAVALALEREQTRLWLRYEDQGPSYDPFATSVPVSLDRPLEERPVGGLGIALIKGFAEATRYHRVADRNCVAVAVRFGAEQEPDDKRL